MNNKPCWKEKKDLICRDYMFLGYPVIYKKKTKYAQNFLKYFCIDRTDGI